MKLEENQRRRLLRDVSRFVQDGADAWQELHQVIVNQDWNNVVEICCRKDSGLTAEAQRKGMNAVRYTLETGFDMTLPESAEKACAEVKDMNMKRAWASPPCTPWTTIQGLNQKTETQRNNLRRKRQESRRIVKHIVMIFKVILMQGGQFYFEWPRNCSGWWIQELVEFREWCTQQNIHTYKTYIDGCAYNMRNMKNEIIKKEWTILTNDADFYQGASNRCQGGHDHAQILGSGSKTVSATGFYPDAMVRRIVQIWLKSNRDMTPQGALMNELYTMDEDEEKKEPEIPEKGKEPEDAERERARALLHRIHRAAGHPANRTLAKLCKVRGNPGWIVKEAENLNCQACEENKRGEQLRAPANIDMQIRPWKMIGIDLFEMYYPAQRVKARYMLMADLAMNLMTIKMTHEGDSSSSGMDSGETLRDAFCETYLQHKPKPQWILVDAQTSLCGGVFAEFCGLAGIGLAVTPGEAHWLHGHLEAMVGVIKRTMKRIRNEHPKMPPKLVGLLAVSCENELDKVKGFSPNQWAYGQDPEGFKIDIDPTGYNAEADRDSRLMPSDFWSTIRHRVNAQKIYLEEKAKINITRLVNASSRPNHHYQVGDWVCVWRRQTVKARKKDDNFSPEARFIGPGRIVIIEPNIKGKGKDGVYWVLMGTRVWRCAAEQLRRATETERLHEIMAKAQVAVRPLLDILKEISVYTDVVKEGSPDIDQVRELPEQPPDEGMSKDDVGDDGLLWEQTKKRRIDKQEDAKPPIEAEGDEATSSARRHVEGAQAENEHHRAEPRAARHQGGHRSRSPVRSFQEQRDRWQTLVDVNNARRLDGMPPLTQLPMQYEDAMTAEYNDDDSQNRRLETWAIIEQMAQAEFELLSIMKRGCDRGEYVYEITLDIDDPRAFLNNNTLYITKKIQSASKEIVYKQLKPEDQLLFDEAMAREVNEVMNSAALRSVEKWQEQQDAQEHSERIIGMRWILTWKILEEPSPPSSTEPTVVTQDGLRKAKARVVLIGYKHPDLTAYNRHGQPELRTASPTLSKVGRALLLQATANDEHKLECADATSAFLQATSEEESRRIWTRGVPELRHAYGVKDNGLLRLIGAIYGLTNAPRIFWRDVDRRLQKIGFIPTRLDPCVWTYQSKDGTVIGRVGTHVDDFLIAGKADHPEWQQARQQVQDMYRWSPWRAGTFTFAGVQHRQLTDYSIVQSQSKYCEALQPIFIKNDRERQAEDPLEPHEISQVKGALMKVQWRAVQTGPALCARVGLANSALSRPTIQSMREANAIIKECQKGAFDDITYHNFNRGKVEKTPWSSMVLIGWGDAGHKNRHDLKSTGGMVIGMSDPRILEGIEAPVTPLDWKSWKLQRVAVGSNSSEEQGIYETEDNLWKVRILWACLNGKQMRRGLQHELARETIGLLVMDSKGCYDALTRIESAGLGMVHAKDGVEMLSLRDSTGDKERCYPCWVPSDLNLGDALTKDTADSRKVWALFHQRKTWVIKFSAEFISARKSQKLKRQQGISEKNAENDEFDLNEDQLRSRMSFDAR